VNGGVEVKLRRETGSHVVPVEEIVATVREKISALEREVHESTPVAEIDG